MIEVGDWIHVKPSELKVKRIIPTQLNSYKNRVQEPYFELHISESKVIMVNGRKIFWSLLDSLFPKDPLPRKPVMGFLQADPHEFLNDLNSFFEESTTPYISIKLGEIPDPKSTVEGSYARPGAVIITANSGLKAPDCEEIADKHNGLVLPGEWVDSKGKHEVPCVFIQCVHIHDLGNKLVVGAVFKNEHGDNVRPLPADTIRKGVGWPSVLASIIDKHIDAAKDAEGRLYPPSVKRNWVYDKSSELMDKEWKLFLRGHQE